MIWRDRIIHIFTHIVVCCCFLSVLDDPHQPHHTTIHKQSQRISASNNTMRITNIYILQMFLFVYFLEAFEWAFGFVDCLRPVFHTILPLIYVGQTETINTSRFRNCMGFLYNCGIASRHAGLLHVPRVDTIWRHAIQSLCFTTSHYIRSTEGQNRAHI